MNYSSKTEKTQELNVPQQGNDQLEQNRYNQDQKSCEQRLQQYQQEVEENETPCDFKLKVDEIKNIVGTEITPEQNVTKLVNDYLSSDNINKDLENNQTQPYLYEQKDQQNEYLNDLNKNDNKNICEQTEIEPQQNDTKQYKDYLEINSINQDVKNNLTLPYENINNCTLTETNSKLDFAKQDKDQLETKNTNQELKSCITKQFQLKLDRLTQTGQTVTIQFENTLKYSQIHINNAQNKIETLDLLKQNQNFDERKYFYKLRIKFKFLKRVKYINHIFKTKRKKIKKTIYLLQYKKQQIKEMNHLFQKIMRERLKNYLVFNPEQYNVFINDRQLYYVGELKNGGFGVVQTYLDETNMMQYAIKKIQIENQKLYDKERNNYLSHLEDISLKGYICQLYGYNDNNLLLCFEQGICDLSQLIEVLKKQDDEPKHQTLSHLLSVIINFIVNLYNRDIYHGDLKPENIIIKDFEDNFIIKQTFAYKYFSYIEFKLIDFQTTSKNPNEYYKFKTPKYTYFGYEGKKNINMKQIFFAEVYSSCKIIYTFLSCHDQSLVDKMEISFQKIFQVIEDSSQKQGLLYFLAIFLNEKENEVFNYLKEQGLSCNLLNYFQKLLRDKSLEIKGENLLFEEFRKFQSQLKQIKSKSIRIKKIQAFSFLNQLQENKIHEIINKQYPTKNLKKIIHKLEIISIYFCIYERQLKCLEEYIIKNIEIDKNTFPDLLQICCFAKCHYYDMYPQIFSEHRNTIIEKFKLHFQDQKVVMLIIDIFNKKISQKEIITQLENIQNQSINNETLYNYYEFIILEAFSLDDFKNKSNELLNQIQFVENMINSNELKENIFLRKVFYRLYLYLYHNSKNCQDKIFCKKFFIYRNLCKKLDNYMGYDVVDYYNTHTLKLKNSYMKLIDPLYYTFFDEDNKRKLEHYLLDVVGDLQNRIEQKEEVYQKLQQQQQEKDIQYYNLSFSLF